MVKLKAMKTSALYQGFLAGMTSPSMLVEPSADYSHEVDVNRRTEEILARSWRKVGQSLVLAMKAESERQSLLSTSALENQFLMAVAERRE